MTFIETRELGALGSTQIQYIGKIVSADEIRFHRAVGAIAEEDFDAKRVK